MKQQRASVSTDGDTTPLPPLPAGWCWSKVCEVGEVKLGRQRSPEHHTGLHMRPYLRVANVYEDRLDLSDVLEMNFTPEEFAQYELRDGDILLNEGQSLEWVGRPAMYRGEVSNCCFQNTLIRFRPGACLRGRFALLIFRHYLHSGRFQKIARWTVNIAHLGAGRFTDLEFPLPPLAEQARITAKVEELFSELDAGVAALKRVQANLKRYRSAVLKAAAQGRLTEAWRADHSPSESGAQLLERILKERRRRWEEEQLAAFAASQKDPPKNWRAKYKEPVSPDTANLPSLPEGWCWAKVGQLLHGIEGGKSFTCLPRAASPTEWGVVKVSAMTWGTFLEDENKAIPPEAVIDPSNQIREGDILLSRSNTAELVGASVLVGACRPKLLLSDKSLRLLLVELVHRRWFHAMLSSKVARRQLSAMATGTSDSMRNVSQEKIESVNIPLPPSEEQAEIVRVVEERLTQLDHLIVDVETKLKRAGSLRQAILKQAFEGNLVAQDPADESASVLLERIRQERMSVPSSGTAEAKKPVKLSREIFARRASVVSYAVRRLSAHKSFGRTQLEKTVHLAQSHLGVDLGFVFERYAAGPFDKDIYKLEAVARKNDWFTTQKRPTFGVTYHPGGKIDQMCEYAAGYLGDRQAAMDRLLDHIAGMNTDEAELFATAYAAWNDLLIDGRPADEDAIVAEVHGWHEEKKRFGPEVVRGRLQWMRQNGYVPSGQGQRTRLVEKATKLNSRRRRKGDASA